MKDEWPRNLLTQATLPLWTKSYCETWSCRYLAASILIISLTVEQLHQCWSLGWDQIDIGVLVLSSSTVIRSVDVRPWQLLQGLVAWWNIPPVWGHYWFVECGIHNSRKRNTCSVKTRPFAEMHITIIFGWVVKQQKFSKLRVLYGLTDHGFRCPWELGRSRAWPRGSTAATAQPLMPCIREVQDQDDVWQGSGIQWLQIALVVITCHNQMSCFNMLYIIMYIVW